MLMPLLLLLRHAKAERASPGESDHERVLAARGREDSATMGRIMAERIEGNPDEALDCVLCSSSQRTRQTWELVQPALRKAPEPRYLKSIFEAGDYLPILRQEGGEARSLLLVGHNPTIMDAAMRLLGKDAGELDGRFPTAALAIIDFDGDWKALKPGSGRLVAFIKPREGESE
jgi:phosphohistidine phosphatase